MKQLAAYYCMGTPGLEAKLKDIQRTMPTLEEFDGYVDNICCIILQEWRSGGLQTATFINHMSLAKRKRHPNVPKFQTAAGATRPHVSTDFTELSYASKGSGRDKEVTRVA
jgi:hypothetical protein